MGILDLFNGQLDLNTVMTTEIALLKELVLSRNKLLEAKAKAKEEAYRNAEKNYNKNINQNNKRPKRRKK